MTALRATVRLQLHAGFDFDAASAQVDYFARLGISHLYLSPVAAAVPGSTHGYDNIDPGVVNPELGGEAGLLRLALAARRHGMGIVLDIVPNHMAAHPANPWWADVLRNGRRSAHADWFDIDWDAPGRDDRLWLPLLDRPQAEAISEGALTLELGPEGPVLRHHEWGLPLSPLSYPAPPSSWAAWRDRCLRSPARLHDLLRRQAYRLVWWRSAPEFTNYRRFFDISGLVALRAERADVFEAVHALPLRLVAEGWVDGLRIDHVDGLADPAGYLQQLRVALDVAGARSGRAPGETTLHVEKILADGEVLPRDWRCDGSTGYDFMDQVGALLHADDAGPALQALWQQRSGDDRSFEQLQQEARRELLQGSLRCDLDRFLRTLHATAVALPGNEDFTPGMFERAVVALLQHFPVYRTHGMQSSADHLWLQQAADAAQAGLDGADRRVLRQVCDWLQASAARADGLLSRFEQVAAPLNAKAVEDTAFYRHARLLSRNEVGSNPARIHLAAEDFVEAARQRGQHWPRAMLALATHDHKRGPDARCRLAVLSWNVEAWTVEVAHWAALAAAAGRPSPLPAAETCLLWQTLLGSWPLAAEALDSTYLERVRGALQKALREGKRVTSWSDPDERLEQSVTEWLGWLEGNPAAGALRSAIDAFVHRLGPAARRLGLVQLALQLVCPGVPDLYQGNEGWDTSLVDPDNRRAVDYEQRRAWLASQEDWASALQDPVSGLPKAMLLARLLQHRVARPSLFTHGVLERVSTDSEDLLALVRRQGEDSLLLVVDRTARLAPQLPSEMHAQGHASGTIAVPSGPWRSLLQGQLIDGGRTLCASQLLGASPVAVWISESGEGNGH